MRTVRAAALLVAAALVATACLDDLVPPREPEPATLAPGEEPLGPGGELLPDDPAGHPPQPEGREIPVVRVVDGDTIVVSPNTRVRLIGIDTPELAREGRPEECFAQEATRFTRRHLEGRRVLLEHDVERLDRFGRTLAYVWVDGRLFNEVLVARGYAVVTTFPPNVRYVERFVAAQERARTRSRGLWRACRDLR